MFNFLNKKPVKINFVIDLINKRERLTWKFLKIIQRLQNGKADIEEIQALAAHFMTDENEIYLTDEKAIAILDDLPEPEIKDVLQKFTDAIAESAIPKANGSVSNLPSVVGQAETLPNG